MNVLRGEVFTLDRLQRSEVWGKLPWKGGFYPPGQGEPGVWVELEVDTNGLHLLGRAGVLFHPGWCRAPNLALS